MTNHLGDFFRRRRVERGLSLGQLAGLAGYRNVDKVSAEKQLAMASQEGRRVILPAEKSIRYDVRVDFDVFRSADSSLARQEIMWWWTHSAFCSKVLASGQLIQ